MEPGQNVQQLGDVDEATRIAAQNRQLTMAPVHDDIIPEDEPDDLIAARHIIGAPIANVESDTETTVAMTVAKHERTNHHIALASSIIVMLIVGAVTTFSFLSR